MSNSSTTLKMSWFSLTVSYKIDTKYSEISEIYFETNKENNVSYFLIHSVARDLIYDHNLTQEENLNIITEWLKEDNNLCDLKPYFYLVSAGTYTTYTDVSIMELPITILNTSLVTSSTKGPINKPIHIKSTSEFLQTFGEYQT